MKKLLICLLLLLTLTACGRRGADLMADASPETSALALYTWDGETGRSQYLFDTDQEQQVLDILNVLPAKKLTGYTLTDAPVYAVSIYNSDGTETTGIWCDGVWITGSGEAYAVDLDMTAILTDYAWEAQDTCTLTSFPGIWFLATDGETWNTAFLTSAQDTTAPDGISLTLDAIDGDTVSASFYNDSAEEFCYGFHYGLQVQLDGQWYAVPAAEAFSVIDLACILPVGGTQQQTYDLSFYGDVPDGDYRLITEQLTVPLCRRNGIWKPS